ncbi:MAG: thiamine-phosphate kinase, partial [Candidatus Omnitrophica bacterium]|nr:thiamine-phosphate kinase [Candidatus Omnitrophota bacterium]
VSDGLAQDLGHILESSSVGAVLYEDLIPVSDQASGLEDALNSGEDFELIFTLNISKARKLMAVSSAFSPIGEIVSKQNGFSIIDKNSRIRKLAGSGYSHF